MVELKSGEAKRLENASYEIVGKHSAVEVCHYTKSSLLGKSGCYKKKFYGIQSHQCVQMTPAASWCDQKCKHCWRANEKFQGMTMDDDTDEPEDIIEGSIKGQLKKLTGFGGNPNVLKDKLEEAQNPKHFAISLTGEPTLYNKMSGLISGLRNKNMSSFLVTHGQHPEALEKLRNENSLPTQLYISMEAPNKELHKKLDVPLLKDAWERVERTFEILPTLKCRRVVRITLMRNLNDLDELIPQFAKLIKKGEIHFIEVKSYMHIGGARKRLDFDNMLAHDEIKIYSEKLAKELRWKVISEAPSSRVCLIAKEDYKWRVMPFANKPITEIEKMPFAEIAA